jgi:Hemerythrin HHE cation binding domain
MDVTTVLKDQHAEIRRAFVRAALPGPRRGGEFRRLVRMLAQHEAAEEAHVHPTTRRIGRRATAAARLGEEERAKLLLARLWQIGPHGTGYLRCLAGLGREVLSHAAREEREEFPALERLGRARRWLLGTEMRLARELAPTRPHPKINGELANKLAMPVLGPADRLRDLGRRLSDSGDKQ